LSAFALCHLEDGAFWQCAGFVRFCSAFVPRSDKQRWPGGEVFVLDMGEPVKIADLARKMMHLMGRQPTK